MTYLIQINMLRKMLFHKPIDLFYLIPAFRNALFKRLSISLYQQRYQQEQIFFFSKIIETFHDHFMQRTQVTGHFFIKDHVFRKSRKFSFPSHFFDQIQHTLSGNIKRTIIQSSIITLYTGMIISGIKKNNISSLKGVFFILTGQTAFSIFHRSVHIILMEMILERLHDPLKTICFQQFVIIDDCSHFFLHDLCLLSEYILTSA